MNDQDINYEITKLSESEFIVVKFVDNYVEQEYSVLNKIGKVFRCSCISGKIRKYCKHKDWVFLIRRNRARELPENVRINTMNDEINKLRVKASLVRQSKQKIKRSVARYENNTQNGSQKS